MSYSRHHHLRKKASYHNWMHSWPAWWDTLYHRRPQRRRERLLLNQVRAGRDPDDVTWPGGRKPHVYYW